MRPGRLANNILFGTIPNRIRRMTNLEHLYLCKLYFSCCVSTAETDLQISVENKLSGTLPFMIGDLTNMKKLLLFANTLDGAIPESIGRMAILEDLSLYENAISGTIPSTIGDLANLRRLALSTCYCSWMMLKFPDTNLFSFPNLLRQQSAVREHPAKHCQLE